MNVTLPGWPCPEFEQVSRVVRARRTDDGVPAAELTIDAGTGLVRLDYGRGPVLPPARPAVFEGEIPPAGTIEMEILLDGAAAFGSLDDRPLALFAFTRSPGATVTPAGTWR